MFRRQDCCFYFFRGAVQTVKLVQNTDVEKGQQQVQRKIFTHGALNESHQRETLSTVSHNQSVNTLASVRIQLVRRLNYSTNVDPRLLRQDSVWDSTDIVFCS